MHYNFEDSVILVTGGSRGIGFAIACEYANYGAKVIIASTNQKRGQQAEEYINQNYKGECSFIQADVTNLEQTKDLFQKIIQQYGKLNIAINNAGVDGCSFTKVHEYPDEVCKEVLDINILGVWHCLKQEIIIMLRQNYGHIVNIASSAGFKASLTGGVPYTASKHAVIGLTKAAAKEYAATGIRINSVCPGLVATDDVKQLINDGIITEINKIHPIGRLIEPIEVAHTILCLTSPNMSVLTGIALPVEGGVLA